MDSYLTFCEHVWQRWQSRSEDVLRATGRILEPDYIPEPYIRFQGARPENKNTLAFLRMNPGQGHPVQERSCLQAGKSPFADLKKSYYDNAAQMDAWFEENLADFARGVAAAVRRNVLNMGRICGFDGVISYESVPFRSHRTNGNQLLKLVRESEFLTEYTTVLQKALSERHVLAIAASQNPHEPTEWNRWLRHFAHVAGLDLSESQNLQRTILRETVNGPSQVLWTQEYGKTKRALIVNNGGARIPADQHTVARQIGWSI